MARGVRVSLNVGVYGGVCGDATLPSVITLRSSARFPRWTRRLLLVLFFLAGVCVLAVSSAGSAAAAPSDQGTRAETGATDGGASADRPAGEAEPSSGSAEKPAAEEPATFPGHVAEPSSEHAHDEPATGSVAGGSDDGPADPVESTPPADPAPTTGAAAPAPANPDPASAPTTADPAQPDPTQAVPAPVESTEPAAATEPAVEVDVPPEVPVAEPAVPEVSDAEAPPCVAPTTPAPPQVAHPQDAPAVTAERAVAAEVVEVPAAPASPPAPAPPAPGPPAPLPALPHPPSGHGHSSLAGHGSPDPGLSAAYLSTAGASPPLASTLLLAPRTAGAVVGEAGEPGPRPD